MCLLGFNPQSTVIIVLTKTQIAPSLTKGSHFRLVSDSFCQESKWVIIINIIVILDRFLAILYDKMLLFLLIGKSISKPLYARNILCYWIDHCFYLFQQTQNNDI